MNATAELGAFILTASTYQTGSTGIGAAQVAWSSSLGVAIISSEQNTQVAGYTTDGITYNGFVHSTNYPFTQATVAWSPTLALFSSIVAGGTGVATSTNATGWTQQTGVSHTGFLNSGNDTRIHWSTTFSRFYVGSTSTGAFSVYSSADGITYTLQSATRTAVSFDSSPSMIVGVGDNGPMYSTDGVTWNNGNIATGMAGVAYSSTLGLWVATNRTGNTEAFTSTDGINWTTITGALSVNRAIIWISSLEVFVAFGDAGLELSTTGTSWQKMYIPGLIDRYGGLYIDEWGMLIAVGNINQPAFTPKRFVYP
jgi:hypothetical protein